MPPMATGDRLGQGLPSPTCRVSCLYATTVSGGYPPSHTVGHPRPACPCIPLGTSHLTKPSNRPYQGPQCPVSPGAKHSLGLVPLETPHPGGPLLGPHPFPLARQPGPSLLLCFPMAQSVGPFSSPGPHSTAPDRPPTAHTAFSGISESPEACSSPAPPQGKPPSFRLH